jgi:hypothetical protein
MPLRRDRACAWSSVGFRSGRFEIAREIVRVGRLDVLEVSPRRDVPIRIEGLRFRAVASCTGCADGGRVGGLLNDRVVNGPRSPKRIGNRAPGGGSVGNGVLIRSARVSG